MSSLYCGGNSWVKSVHLSGWNNYEPTPALPRSIAMLIKDFASATWVIEIIFSLFNYQDHFWPLRCCLISRWSSLGPVKIINCIWLKTGLVFNKSKEDFFWLRSYQRSWLWTPLSSLLPTFHDVDCCSTETERNKKPTKVLFNCTWSAGFRWFCCLASQ